MIVIGVMVSITLAPGMTFADKTLPLVFDTQFQLKVNQTFSINSTGITVKFLNVTADSRCPSDVTCIWQGETRILVNVIQNNQDRGNFNLASSAGQQNLAVRVFDGYSISVGKVEPYPLGGKKLPPSDYLVTFEITKFGVSSPLHQFKSGVNSSDVKCNSIFQLVIKAADGSPACVTPPTAQKLIERGWAKSTSSVTTPDSTKIITLQQNNQEITLSKGQRFLLNLGSNYDWSLNVDNNTVISRVPNITVTQGAQGLFEAHYEGKTILGATGDPPCLKATPRCGMPSILFKVNVIVS
ncbi:MAG: hypothetical protein D4R90_03760 [Nitrosopumilales archaeon]|nr:MAG: hypothetical protein D4R90_03760 [Nitrosopumilales archaeon]